METLVLILKIMALVVCPLIVVALNLAFFTQSTSFFWDPAGLKKTAATFHNTIVYLVSVVLGCVCAYLLYVLLF